MKKKGICLLLMLVMPLAGFYGCHGGRGGSLRQLEAPVVELSGQYLTWQKITGAAGYEVFMDGEKRASTQFSYYEITDAEGEHRFSVIAKGDGKTTADSPSSNEVGYTGERPPEPGADALVQRQLADGSWAYSGVVDEAIRFVQMYQLKQDHWWRLMENVFATHRDSDGGYSAEFYGKLLRGAALTYRYTLDTELYAKATQSVRNILAIQRAEPEGRLSGYDVAHEFTGWDLRSRSYLLLGLTYYYEICEDEGLRAEVLSSLRDQLDYVMARVGGKEGQIPILETSPDWGGCTSANMLEGVVRVYELTGDETYREYARYIIDTGGSTMLSDEGTTLVQDVLAGKPMYEWGIRKFYEVANFIEGIFQYYFATGDPTAKRIALNFYRNVAENEVTEVGGIATDVEEANHAAVEQADPDNVGRMQENCCATVWAKLCLRVFQLTGDPSAMEQVEKSYYNYFLGSVDWDRHDDFVFHSYSPCATTARTTEYSGTAFLDDTHVQSCCVMSAVSALPLIAQNAVTRDDRGFSVNLYFDGKVTTSTPGGSELWLLTETKYPAEGTVAVALGLAAPEAFALRFRIPAWSRTTTVAVNGVAYEGAEPGGYLQIERVWRNGDRIELVFDMRAYLIYGSEECSNPNARYNVVVKRGPLVFARDRRIEGDGIFEPLSFAADEAGYLDAQTVEAVSFRNQCALRIKKADGTYVTLIDYGSAGKTRDSESVMCLWIPTRDYWSVDRAKALVIKSNADHAPNQVTEDGHLRSAPAYAHVTDPEVLQNFAWRLEDAGGGYYRIKIAGTADYLTVDADYRVVVTAEDRSERQRFRLNPVGLNKFQIVAPDGLVLSKHDDRTIYMYDNINHANQVWYMQELPV